MDAVPMIVRCVRAQQWDIEPGLCLGCGEEIPPVFIRCAACDLRHEIESHEHRHRTLSELQSQTQSVS